MRGRLALATGLLIAAGWSEPSAAAPLDGYAIYERARDVCAAQQYPEIVRYGIVMNATEAGKPVARHYRGQWIPSDNDVRVDALSEEEAQTPHVPKGVNFHFDITISIARGGSGGRSIPFGRKDPDPDLIGVPLLAPAYSFGLVEPPAAQPQQSDLSTKLPVIAAVTTRDQRYDITVAGTDSIDGGDAYHLLLKPRRDPESNRLRELWVGTGDFTPVKAIVSGNFTVAPFDRIPWSVDFVKRDGALYILTESALKPIAMERDRTFYDLTISFEPTPDSNARLLLPSYGADSMLREPDTDLKDVR